MKNQKVFQAGVLTAFLQGIYDGDMTFAELCQHGDFGIGTFNGLAGELIILNGVVYRADETSRIQAVPESTMTPIAMLTFFNEKVKEIAISNLSSFDDLKSELNQHILSPNLIHAIQIHGTFCSLHIRSESCQPRPYQPLTQTLASVQREFFLENVKGTLVCFYFPAYLGTINIPGYHMHFIDEDRQQGGHVLGLNLTSAKVRINPIHQFEVALPNTTDFHRIELANNIERATELAEKGK